MRKTDEQIVADVFKREGWPKVTDDASDLGGLTVGGITYAAACEFANRTWTRAEFIAWAKDRDNATAFYVMRHVRPFDLLNDPEREFVIDLGVLRGVRTATIVLQQIVGADADGWVGAETMRAAQAFGSQLLAVLVGARLQHIESRIAQNATQAKYRKGWRARTLSFLP